MMWKRYQQENRIACTLFFLITLSSLPHGATSAEFAGTWLTSDGFPKRGPCFYPGRNEIIFASESPKTAGMRLLRLNLDTKEVTPFFPKKPAGSREFAISLNGKVFAYNVVRGLSSKIHVVNQETSAQVTIPRIDKANWSNWPSISPDGSRLVYVEGAHVMYEFDIRENKGKESIRRMTHQGAEYSDYWPSYSHDGKLIVFGSNRDDDFEIYLMNSDGTSQRRLTHSPGIDMHPVFSPDGKRIAFTSNRNGNHDIYLLDLDSLKETRVTRNAEHDDFACWHPDGKRLVMVSEHQGERDLRWRDVSNMK